MERILISGEEARRKVLEGIKKGTMPVADSLGPFGNLSLIEKGTRITNDGAKILQEITLEDEVEELGLRKLKEAVAKSNDVVGDGSTTITVLTHAILKEAKRELGGAMTTGDFLKKLASERDEVIEKLTESATPITTEEELVASATVSVDDAELGKLIGQTQWKLGKEGYILAEEGNEATTTVEMVQGIRTDNGVAVTQLFNNQDNTALEVENVSIILTDSTISTLKPLEDVLNQLLTKKQFSVALVARGFTDVAIQECAANFAKGFKIYPLNAPYTDSRQVMKDLEALLGGRYMDTELHSLEDMQLSDVGFAAKIKATRFSTVFTGTSNERIPARIEELKNQLEGSLSDFENKLLASRIAQLESGFSLITVGAESETERKRVFDKVEDAVNAVRAALQEGTVKGAGLAFKEIADTLPAGSLLKNPLTSIHDQILKNAPADFTVEPWVRDPVKVLRIALEQAVSVGGALATISSVITTKKQRYNAYVNPQSND